MNLPAKGWEIYYADGSVLSHKNSSWDEIPKNNVVIIIIWHDYHIPGVRQKDLLVGRDYYYYDDPDSWGCTDDFELVKDKEFKRGVWIEDELMESIFRVAFEKLDF